LPGYWPPDEASQSALDWKHSSAAVVPITAVGSWQDMQSGLATPYPCLELEVVAAEGKRGHHNEGVTSRREFT
jgi:hypothetical protein